MQQIEHRTPPAGQLGHQDDIDLAGLGQCHDALAFGAVILGSGGSFLPDADDFVTGLLCESPEVPLLARAGLIGGGDSAVDGGGLSQLNPLRTAVSKAAIFQLFAPPKSRWK